MSVLQILLYLMIGVNGLILFPLISDIAYLVLLRSDTFSPVFEESEDYKSTSLNIGTVYPGNGNLATQKIESDTRIFKYRFLVENKEYSGRAYFFGPFYVPSDSKPFTRAHYWRKFPAVNLIDIKYKMLGNEAILFSIVLAISLIFTFFIWIYSLPPAKLKKVEGFLNIKF